MLSAAMAALMAAATAHDVARADTTVSSSGTNKAALSTSSAGNITIEQGA